MRPPRPRAAGPVRPDMPHAVGGLDRPRRVVMADDSVELGAKNADARGAVSQQRGSDEPRGDEKHWVGNHNILTLDTSGTAATAAAARRTRPHTRRPSRYTRYRQHCLSTPDFYSTCTTLVLFKYQHTIDGQHYSWSATVVKRLHYSIETLGALATPEQWSYKAEDYDDFILQKKWNGMSCTFETTSGRLLRTPSLPRRTPSNPR